MAFLYVAEFSELPISDNGTPLVGMTPAIAEQKLAVGVGSVASSAFNPLTRFVRLHTDAICSVAFAAAGATATAAVTNARLAANQTEYFGVQGTGTVAVITNT